MAGNTTEGIIGIIDKILGLSQSNKISSIQRVNCKKCNTDNLEAIVIVFDDGQTLVSCPADRGNRRCHYEIEPRPTGPTRWYQQRWFTYLILLLFFIGAIFVQYLLSNG